jgi:hypothetical protein
LKQPIKPHCWERLIGVNKEHIRILPLSFSSTQHLTKHTLSDDDTEACVGGVWGCGLAGW